MKKLEKLEGMLNLNSSVVRLREIKRIKLMLIVIFKF